MWLVEQQIALDRAGGVVENVVATCSALNELSCPLELAADPQWHKTTDLVSFIIMFIIIIMKNHGEIQTDSIQ